MSTTVVRPQVITLNRRRTQRAAPVKTTFRVSKHCLAFHYKIYLRLLFHLLTAYVITTLAYLA